MHPNFEIDFLSNRENLIRIIDKISELIEDFKTEGLKTNKFTVALNYPHSDFGSEVIPISAFAYLYSFCTLEVI